MTSPPASWNATDQALLQTCLDKVLASPVFEKSYRQQDLLRHLFKETLNGNAQRLKGYTLGVEVFGRGTDFDPALDAIVRVEVGRLRAKLREYYDTHGQSDAAVIELPKGSYVVNITLRDSSTPQAQVLEPNVNPWPKAIDSRPSLAVLPFANMSSDAGQDYFVDGLADSLIFELSRLSGLFVISRQSSFTYRGSSKSAGEISKELGVKYLLEGSVQLSGQRIRVTANLLEASSGGHLWSERHESDLQEIFALQDKIVLSIVKALQIKLAGAEAELFGHEGTESIDAHDALLRGMECHWKYSPKFVAEARIHFARAVEFDPAYAAAHAWLARSMLFLWIMRWDQDTSLRDRAYEHAKRAVALNERLAYALAILGWAHLWNKQRDASISTCREAVALDPNNSEAHVFLSHTLAAAGYGEEALYYAEKAQRFNPNSSTLYEHTLGQAYMVLEDYDKAIAAFKRGTALNETYPPNHLYLCAIYALLGKGDEMRASREAYFSIMGGDKSRTPEPPWTDEGLAATYAHLFKIAGIS